jgi:transposase InsO family protein
LPEPEPDESYGRLQQAGIAASMGGVGTAYDNAAAESLFAGSDTRRARTAIFQFIEVFYNRRRIHSSIGYLSPEGFARRLCQEQKDVTVA